MAGSWQNMNNILVDPWHDLVEILARSQQNLERSWQDMNNIIEIIMARFYENLGKVMARSCKLTSRFWQKFNCSFFGINSKILARK